MQKVKEGDYVSLTYEGTLANGEIFESAADENPFEFVIGQQSVFPSFESGVIGMIPGETKSIKVGPDEAYGKHREELVQIINRSAFGAEIEIKPGIILGMTIKKEDREHQVPALIVAVEDDQVTLDYNHPLAGQELLYQITLKSIAAEGESGHEKDCG